MTATALCTVGIRRTFTAAVTTAPLAEHLIDEQITRLALRLRSQLERNTLGADTVSVEK